MFSKVMEVFGLLLSMTAISCADTEPLGTWLLLAFVGLCGFFIALIGYKIEKKGENY